MSFDEIAKSSPSETLLRNILNETATDVMFLIYYRIFYEDKIGGKVPSLFLSCDKATDGGSKVQLAASNRIGRWLNSRKYISSPILQE